VLVGDDRLRRSIVASKQKACADVACTPNAWISRRRTQDDVIATIDR